MEKKIMKIMKRVVPIHQPLHALLARNVIVDEESVFIIIVDEIKSETTRRT